MSVKQYQVRLYGFGQVTTASGVTTYNANLVTVPSVGGQVIRYAQGRVESHPYQVELIDNSTSVTSVLSDSSGRMDVMGRVMDIRVKIGASTAWTSLTAGRVNAVELSDNPAGYRFTVDDELSVVRQATIFPYANTQLIYPAGIRNNWMRFHGALVGTTASANARVIATTGNYFKLAFTAGAGVMGALQTYDTIHEDISRAVIADVNAGGLNSSSPGSFKSLVCAVSTSTGSTFSNQPVVTFDDVFHPGYLGTNPVTKWEQRYQEIPSPWVYWGTTPPVIGSRVWAYLFMAGTGAVSGEGNLLHIGGSSGMHPMNLALRVLQNQHGGFASSSAVRISTAAWSGSTGLLADPRYGLGWWRVSEPQNAGQWLEDNIWGPYQVVPFIDNNGRIAPRSIALPSSATVNIGTAQTFGSSNLSQHPTWRHSPEGMYTQLQVRWTSYYQPDPNKGSFAGQQAGADGIAKYEHTLPVNHDRIQQLGTRTLNTELSGLHDALLVERQANFLAKELFDRVGDGPIEGEAIGCSTGQEAVKAGDYVKIRLATFPNPLLQGRGGTRLVQITSVVKDPAGPNFTWYDAGPSAQALSAPTVTLAASTVSAYNALKVTIASVSTSSTSGGATAQLQMVTSSSQPGSSASWVTVMSGASSGAYNIPALDSGSPWWARARNVRSQRLRSAYGRSTAATNTTRLQAPTGAATTSVGLGQASITWSNTSNSSGYPVEVLLGAGSTGNYFKNSVNLAYQKFDAWADLVRPPLGSTAMRLGFLINGNATGGAGSQYHVINMVYWTSTSVFINRSQYYNGSVIANGLVSASGVNPIFPSWLPSSGKRLGITVYTATFPSSVGTDWAQVWTEPLGGGARIAYSTFTLGSTRRYSDTGHQRFGLWWQDAMGGTVDTFTVTTTGGATSTTPGTAIAKDLMTGANGTLLSAHTPTSGFAAWSLGPGGGNMQIQSNKAQVYGAGSTNLVSVGLLPAGSRRYTFAGLSPTIGYTAAVRAHDPPPLGGYSTVATVSFIGSSANAAPSMRAIARLFGTT